MNTIDVTFVKLEDGRECIILDEFNIEEKKYVLLVNSLNQEDFILREVINDNLVGIENEEVFKKIFFEYIKKIN